MCDACTEARGRFCSKCGTRVEALVSSAAKSSAVITTSSGVQQAGMWQRVVTWAASTENRMHGVERRSEDNAQRISRVEQAVQQDPAVTPRRNAILELVPVMVVFLLMPSSTASQQFVGWFLAHRALREAGVFDEQTHKDLRRKAVTAAKTGTMAALRAVAIATHAALPSITAASSRSKL